MGDAAAPLPEEPGAPAPRRGWRHLLTELVIVTLGVGIALAGQQVVDGWREQRQYQEAREAMRAELENNLASLEPRTMISACNRKRLDEIGVLLDKAEKGQAFDPPSWIGQASSGRIRYTSETEAARSGLFAPEEQRLFGRLYSFLHSIDDEQDRERQAWARLQVLDGRSSLPPESLARLREALAEARFEDERIALLLRFVKSIGDELSLTKRFVNPDFWPKAWPACLPINTSREEGLRLTRYPDRLRP